MADCPNIILTTVTDKTDGSTASRSYEEPVPDADSTLCNVSDADFYDKGIASGLGAGGGGTDGVGVLVVDYLTLDGVGTVTLSEDPNGDLAVFAIHGGAQIEVTDYTITSRVLDFGAAGILGGSLICIYTKDAVAGGSTPTVIAGDLISEELALSGDALIITGTPQDSTGVLVWYGGVKMDNALVVGGTGDYTVSGKVLTTIATGVIPNGSTLTVVYQVA